MCLQPGNGSLFRKERSRKVRNRESSDRTSLQVLIGGILEFVIIIEMRSCYKKYILANEWI